MAQQTLKPDDLARMDPAQLIALTAPERLAEMKRPALARLAKHLREARDAVENKAQRKDIAVAFRAANDEKQQRKAASEGEPKTKAPKGQKAVKGGQAAQKKGAGQKVGQAKVAEQADVKVKAAKAKPADKQAEKAEAMRRREAEKAEAMRRREAEKAEKKRVRAAEKAEKQAGAKAAREAEKASRKAARIAARADNAQ